MMMSASAPMISCWSAIACMYFCDAAPAVNSAIFFAFDERALRRERPIGSFGEARPGEYFVHQSLDCGQQRKLTGHGALQQPPRDDQAIDFVCAFEDAVHAGIAIHALGGILFDESVPAEDLHHFIDDVVEHLRTPDFQDGALNRVLLDLLANFLAGIGGFLVHL